jgi:hypothetical protein
MNENHKSAENTRKEQRSGERRDTAAERVERDDPHKAEKLTKAGRDLDLDELAE